MTRIWLAARVAAVAALAVSLTATTVRAQRSGGAVTLSEDEQTYTLDNGVVKAMVAKASGDLVSLEFKGMEMLATRMNAQGKPDLELDTPGATVNGLNRGMTDHQYGFWSHDAMGPRDTRPAVAKVTIDPKTNSGERAEVSVKGISKDRYMGTGPGANPNGQFASDIEIRWALGRGDSGVYTYSIFNHPADYPATSIGEARFCAKLNEFFDWLSAGTKYNKLYPKEQEKGEDKYVYTTIQSENRAFGWSSTTRNVGFYIINPSMEYMSGGPTKPEFLGHRDTNAVAAPCVLNYWRSSHYGGASVDVAAGEQWSKVVGPFMLFVTSGADPNAMYETAKAQAKAEDQKWPYDWVKTPEYAPADQRATVSGQIVLDDPQMSASSFKNLQVGLTHPAYEARTYPAPAAARAGRGGRGPTTGQAPAARGPATPPPPRIVDWQTDAKFYQFWTRADDSGKFSIPDVIPGTYTLHAFADGILGEFAKADITVQAGKPLDLGTLKWTPLRKGKQLWEIGIPNRNASEFFKGDEYTALDIPLQYAKLFPNDVNYVIGKSDFRKDWYFEQVPHNVDPNAAAAPFYGIRGEPGKATPFKITFDLPSAPKGKATLRLAICGGGARSIDVSVNDKPAGEVDRLVGDGVITRHQIQGIWYEREVPFDASMLKQGTNTLTLTVPAGPVNNGVLYDYLRLELDESAQ
jgi:rhamnogalacturonan endolyase